jgi:hypothetical protein
MSRTACALLFTAVLLAGCGSTTEDRALSGAGIGAAGGAAVGAVTGLSILQGVALGAVAGGATGALTDESQIDLGKPLWQRDSSGASGVVREIQSGLAKLGYAPGPADGISGQQTQAAIRRYQEDNGLLVDGQATPQLAEHIRNRLG